MLNTPTPKPKNHTTEIYETLRHEILNLSLPPGTSIGEVEMSKRFNISRTPIREVFKHLELERLIKIIPNKGTVVTPINFNTITEFMYIREKLEIGVVEDVINVISEENLAMLNLNLIKQQKLLNNDEISLQECAVEFYNLDNQFHRCIFGCVNKESILDLALCVMPDYKRYRVVAAGYNSMEQITELFDHHNKIMLALESKDLISLKAIYKEHVYFGTKDFRELIARNESYFVI